MTKVKIGYLRVLIVDDSNIPRSLMREMLEKSGFNHIDEAVNAAEAHEKMDALRYDLVFLDWVMPGKSGISLLGEWREDRRYDDVAICVVSMQNDKSLIASALKTGALSYIVKPVTAEALQKSVEQAVKWLELRREFRERQND